MATPQKNAPGKLFAFGSIIVGLSFYINSELPEKYQLKADQLAAIYTGLGIAGLVATYWHQREEAEDANRKHDEVLSAMKTQAVVAAYSSKLSAIIAKRTRCLSEMAMPDQNAADYIALNRTVGDLDRQIDDMVDNFPS